MKNLSYIFLFIVLALVIVWKFYYNPQKFVAITINDRTFQAVLADEPQEWQRGLSGQSKQFMMLFVFPDKQSRSFWMKDMRYPIDIVWLADGRVVGVTKDLSNVLPANDVRLPSYLPPQPVNMILEIPVDLRQNLGLNIEAGDTININI